MPDTIGDTLRADAFAYWTMNESSGTRVDATGHGHDLNTVSNIGTETGKASDAASLLSSVCHLRRSEDFGLSDISYGISFWLKFHSLPSEQARTVLASYNSATSFVNLICYVDDYGPGYGNVLVFGNDPTDTGGNISVTTETWYFVVGEFDKDNGKLRITVNGTVDEIDSGDNIRTTDTFTIGDGEDNTIESAVDEVLLIIGRVFTSDEKAYLYNGGDGKTLYPAPEIDLSVSVNPNNSAYRAKGVRIYP